MIRKVTAIRIGFIVAAVLALQAACQTGLIGAFTMISPWKMLTTMIGLRRNPDIVASVEETFVVIAISLVAAVIVGFIVGAILHALPRLRRIANPLLVTYYSVPVFVFYPLLIVLFGLNAVPKTVIGFLYAVVAMVIATLNGLDRVPGVFWKTSQVYQLGWYEAMTRLIIPSASPYLFTGVKLAVVYCFIGVIGSEFILSSGGIGYQIGFAYNNFQVDVLYGLMLFVLIIVVFLNMGLYAWERRLMERRGGR